MICSISQTTKKNADWTVRTVDVAEAVHMTWHVHTEVAVDMEGIVGRTRG
jgi:hypothetical protein